MSSCVVDNSVQVSETANTLKRNTIWIEQNYLQALAMKQRDWG